MSDLLAPPSQPAPSDALCVREVQFRAAAVGDDDAWEFSGIAVPWDEETEVWDLYDGHIRERFARGSVTLDANAKFIYRHGEVVGRITAGRDTDRGFEITARISQTTLGRDVYQLMRDGVIDRLSVGFRPIKQEREEPSDPGGLPLITRTETLVREVSGVPFPAYDGATVDNVRHAHPPKENHMTATTEERADVTELRAHVDEMDRRFELLVTQLERQGDDENAAPPVTFRSAGELLKAVVSGDEAAQREYVAWKEYLTERDWNPAGATTADSVVHNGWVGDLSRIPGAQLGIRGFFAGGVLPAEGNSIEWARVTANTIDVTQQADQGDTLAFGKVTIAPATSPVNTYGGYTRLSRQVIERSSVNYLNTSLLALDVAAAKRLNAGFRTAYETAAAANAAAGNNRVILPATIDTPAEVTVDHLIDLVIDGAEKFEDSAWEMQALLADKPWFKILAKIKDPVSGERLMNVYGEGVNQVGSLNLPGISGNILRVPVIPNFKQVTPAAAAGAWSGLSFANGNALRTYANALANLNDEDITTLSKDYSVYRYAAFAFEQQDALVPVVYGAGA
ncbi:HK97 family phage prohead protease [Promicromonospora sp. NPDC050262]|uniref:HK97 family phage prohead protease n=1 Tax=Promicromonospora sp. NPDC050262 TaxID=3155036 RepID=UPI00340406B8